MLDNWLNSSSFTKFDDKSAIGLCVQTLFSQPKKGRESLYIVTDGSDFSKKSKEALYLLKNHFDNLDIYDLGNLKNDNPEFVIAVIRELAISAGKVILITKHDIYFDSIFRALENVQDNISMAFLNSKLDQLLEESTSRSLKSEKLLNISALGYQRHYCTPNVLNYLHESFVHHLSFGQLRENISRAEPILRSAHAAAIDTAILNNDASGIPNGLNSLEICQLAKYCGMSTNLKVLSISDQNGNDNANKAHLAAQMIWYFIEGIYLYEDIPDLKSSGNFQEHLVRTDYSDQSFTFWKSNRTNRWWFEIPNADGNRGNVYPCNHADYDLACRNEISSYLLDQINLDH